MHCCSHTHLTWTCTWISGVLQQNSQTWFGKSARTLWHCSRQRCQSPWTKCTHWRDSATYSWSRNVHRPNECQSAKLWKLQLFQFMWTGRKCFKNKLLSASELRKLCLSRTLCFSCRLWHSQTEDLLSKSNVTRPSLYYVVWKVWRS